MLLELATFPAVLLLSAWLVWQFGRAMADTRNAGLSGLLAGAAGVVLPALFAAAAWEGPGRSVCGPVSYYTLVAPLVLVLAVVLVVGIRAERRARP